MHSIFGLSGAVDGDLSTTEAVDHGGYLCLPIQFTLNLTKRILTLFDYLFLLTAYNFQRRHLGKPKQKAEQSNTVHYNNQDNFIMNTLCYLTLHS